MPVNQSTNCGTSGWSRPSCVRIASISPMVAVGPPIWRAGSPGMSRMNKKTMMETTNMSGIMLRIRLTTYFPI